MGFAAAACPGCGVVTGAGPCPDCGTEVPARGAERGDPGVAVAGSATDSAQRIRQLVERDREAVHGLGRGAASALRVHELAGRRVVLTANSTSALLGLSAPTVNAAFARLEEVGILREVTGRRRGRIFAYAAYLELLQAE